MGSDSFGVNEKARKEERTFRGTEPISNQTQMITERILPWKI